MTAPVERLAELWQKLDLFFERARAAHGDAIACRAGCDDCCRRRFSVTRVEAAALRAHLAALPGDVRARLRERAVGGDPGACPALGEGGRCEVYAARPVICRTHGLALRFREPGRSLPVLDACPKNFPGRDLATLDPSTVLDQATLSTILAALDAAQADAEGTTRGERAGIADLLAAR